MLSPEYLAACVSILLGMMDEINYAVMADIARRLVKTNILTESAEFQTERLLQNGLTLKEIQHTVSNLSNLTESEVRRIFDEANLENMESENLRAAIAGKTPLDHSANTAMANLLAAHIRKTVGDVRNLTRTTASQGQDSFFRACTLANMQVSSGAFTYDFAIKNAIRQVAKEGLKVQYPTGHVDKLDVAVRRAVLTGVNQSAAELNMMYADEIGADLVEVTAHTGARPSHAVWQGGIYSRSGKNSSYPSFIESTGYGTGDGLCGWNCRHSFHAYYEGSPRTYSREYLENLDKDVYEYRDKTYTIYEAGQKQRAYERAIREEKRYLAGLNAAYKETSDQALKTSLRADMESSAVRLKRTEANMKIFCKATNRKVDNVRTQVYAVKDASGKIVGFDKSAAQRARQIAIRHHMDWLKSIGADDASLKNLDKYYIAKYNISPAYKHLMDYQSLVKQGELSPLLGFRIYYTYAQSLEKHLVGIKTPLGFEVTDFTPHFVGRMIGEVGYNKTKKEYSRKGVDMETLIDCLKNGTIGKTQINKKGERSVVLFTDRCKIAVNPDTKVLIQCNSRKIVTR